MQAFLHGQIMFSVFFSIVPVFGQRFELTLVFGSISMTYDTAYWKITEIPQETY